MSTINKILFPNNVKRLLKVRESYVAANQAHNWVVICKMRRIFCRIKNERVCRRNNCFIPLNCRIGNGVVFPHGLYGIFISQGAVIGKNCTIFHHVTIGSNNLNDSKGAGAPHVGDNVFIGAGAKIIGNVRIGDNVRIGAGAVVAGDVPDNATVVMPKAVIIQHDERRDNTFVNYGEHSGQGK